MSVGCALRVERVRIVELRWIPVRRAEQDGYAITRPERLPGNPRRLPYGAGHTLQRRFVTQRLLNDGRQILCSRDQSGAEIRVLANYPEEMPECASGRFEASLS